MTRSEQSGAHTGDAWMDGWTGRERERQSETEIYFISYVIYHMSYQIISYHIISHPTRSDHIESDQIITYHISCIMSYHESDIISYRITSSVRDHE